MSLGFISMTKVQKIFLFWAISVGFSNHQSEFGGEDSGLLSILCVKDIPVYEIGKTYW